MYRWIRTLCVLVGFAATMAACDEPQTTAPSDVGTNDIGSIEDPGEEMPDLGSELRLNIDGTTPPQHDWSNQIVSEAFYALSQSRSGGSGLTYNGWAMGDWPYPQFDSYALTRMTNYIGSENVGPLKLWSQKYQQGGWCKFFTDLILYRSSYGYGNNWHLVLPSGYTYATRSTRDAQPGWVLQSATVPHTAVVVARYGAGLDVVDSNYIGTYYDQTARKMVYSYALGRHMLPWSELDQKSYKSYCPWVDGYSNGGWGLTRY